MTTERSGEADVDVMMAEDYFALGKFEKAMAIYKRIGKSMPKEKLEEYAKKSLADGDIKNALSAFKAAGADKETIKQAFADQATELLKSGHYVDVKRLKEILSAGGIKPAENEEIRNCLVKLAKDQMTRSGSATWVLEMYRISGADIPRKEVLEMAAGEIKNGTVRRKEEGIAIMVEFGAKDELREVARYFLNLRKPNEKMARQLYEVIDKLSESK